MEGRTNDSPNATLRVIMANTGAQPWWERLRAAMRELHSQLIVYSFAPKAKSSMCTYYGHVIDYETWNSHSMPRCQDCSAEVKSSADLRGAQVKQRSSTGTPAKQ